MSPTDTYYPGLIPRSTTKVRMPRDLRKMPVDLFLQKLKDWIVRSSLRTAAANISGLDKVQPSHALLAHLARRCRLAQGPWQIGSPYKSGGYFREWGTK